MNPLPDRANFATPTTPSLWINTSLVLWARPFTKPQCWRLVLHCCNALLQNLVGNSCLPQCLEDTEQQAEESGVVPPSPLQIDISTPFCLILFSLYIYALSAHFLNPFSSPFPHFPSLSTIPSLSSDQFSDLLN